MLREKRNSSLKNNVFKNKSYKQERKLSFDKKSCQQIQWPSRMLREKEKKVTDLLKAE